MMLPPIVVILLTLEFFMSATGATKEEFGPYDGPLAERALASDQVHPHMGFQFSIVADTPRLQRFERWLRRHPIYVRAPGEKYIVFGMKAWNQARGELCIFTANTLLPPSDQPLGPWIGDGGEMLKWAFSVVDHYGFDYAPERQYMRKTRQQLIDWYHSDSVPVDWQAVAERLRATGRPVPDDLFDEHD